MTQSTITKPTYMFRLLALPAAIALSSNTLALSLDEAVNQQLRTPLPSEGLGLTPCRQLLQSGADLTGNLLDTICSRAAPGGATPSSSGGGSATPVTLPSSSFSDTKQSSNSLSEELVSTNNWQLFFTVENESLDRDASDTETAYDSDKTKFVLGTTYSPDTKSSYSLALSTAQHDGSYENGGGFEYETTAMHLIASFQASDNLYFDLSASYEDVSAEQERATTFDDILNGGSIFSLGSSPISDYSYDQTGFSIQGGYDINSGRLTLTPVLGIDWLSADYGTYTEQGDSGLELTFHDDEKDSLQAVVGLQTSYVMETGFGAFIPQLDLMWRNEFKDDSRDVNVSFAQDLNSTQFSYQTDELDSSFAELSAGGVFVFKGGTQAFINLQTLLAHEYFDSFVANAGLRLEF